MKINAVGVTSSDFKKTIEFYSILGVKFPEYEEGTPHVDSIAPEGSARLMIDSVELITELIGEKPTHSNHSAFAFEYDSPAELDGVVADLQKAGFTVKKQPWDAFWRQRYAVVIDPDGYCVDLYASL